MPEFSLGRVTNSAVAPCGPECRYASPLPANPDYIWCSRLGVPRSTGRGAVDCPWFNPRTLGIEPIDNPARNDG